jgi:hypothetical protein
MIIVSDTTPISELAKVDHLYVQVLTLAQEKDGE